MESAGTSFFSAIGLCTVIYITYNIARVVLSTFILPGKPLSTFGPRGSWALITGASDGIGKEFALQLAKKGLNLLLVSRTASKLQALSSTITEANAGVRVETFAMDFAASSDTDYSNLSAKIDGKDVSILVNNVGQSHDIPVLFAETPQAEMERIIQINCTATLRITQLVLLGMQQRKHGLIMTMGSFGGLVPTPFLATYSGSKAFLQHWSNSLASEVATSGIAVHFIHSYLVTSAMSKIKRSSWLVPSEKTFVKSVLSKVGRRGGSMGYTHSGSPYWSHALVAMLMTGVLGVYSGILLSINRNMHVSIRKRALKKIDREKASGKKSI